MVWALQAVALPPWLLGASEAPERESPTVSFFFSNFYYGKFQIGVQVEKTAGTSRPSPA